jgi:hypothetical protein
MERDMDGLDLSRKIAKQMRSEVPDAYHSHVIAFEELSEKGLMRAAYAEADELRRKQDWQPSSKLNGMILSFQQVF